MENTQKPADPAPQPELLKLNISLRQRETTMFGRRFSIRDMRITDDRGRMLPATHVGLEMTMQGQVLVLKLPLGDHNLDLQTAGVRDFQSVSGLEQAMAAPLDPKSTFIAECGDLG